MKIKNIKNNQKEIFIKNLEKAYTEGIYADTPANRKLGRVGMSYKEWIQKQSDNKEKNGNSENLIKDIPFEEVKTRFGGYKYYDFEDGDRIEIHWSNRSENKDYVIIPKEGEDKFVSEEDLIKYYNNKKKNKEGKDINKLPWVRTKTNFGIEDKIIKGNYAIIRDSSGSHGEKSGISETAPRIVEVDKEGNIIYSGPNGAHEIKHDSGLRTTYSPKNIQNDLSDKQVLDFLDGKVTFEDLKKEGGKAYDSYGKKKTADNSYTKMNLSDEEKKYIKDKNKRARGIRRTFSRPKRR